MKAKFASHSFMRLGSHFSSKLTIVALQIKIPRIRFAQVERSSYFSRYPNAIDGLLAECMEAIAKFKNTTALDASIIAGVQAVHYKIACYRMLKSWAKR